MVECLVKELGANVNNASREGAGATPLYIAAQEGHLDVVRCLVLELHADVNQADQEGATPLYSAAYRGNLAMVQVLVKELDADINQAKLNGGTPLMTATAEKHASIVRWLVKAGADTQATAAADGTDFTAARVSKHVGASAEQTAYLLGKTHCSHPSCSGAGLLKCTGCR
jgi:ankyrin repeat protein